MRVLSELFARLTAKAVLRSGIVAAAALVGMAFLPAQAQAQTSPCHPSQGTFWFCDDFNGSVLDTTRWTAKNTNIGNQYPVRPGNITRTTVNDNGNTITVIRARVFGDLHSGPKRQGGVIVTNARYGGGRYEVRMKNLPGPNGCSCIWNYYASEDEGLPPPMVYTEIDIEMPAHLGSPPAWNNWRKRIGVNTYEGGYDDSDAVFLSPTSTINPFDGQFHVYRWDWRDGANGVRKIDWYIDNVLLGSTTQKVGTAPAQLWVGAWAPPWAGMDYNFDTKDLYIDWVRMSALP